MTQTLKKSIGNTCTVCILENAKKKSAETITFYLWKSAQNIRNSSSN